MGFSKAQRRVAFGMASGLLVTLACLAAVALLRPTAFFAATLLGRLQLLAASALAPTIALTVAIARLAAHRFRTPRDLDGSGLAAGTERAKVLQALLQNTLEQMVLALPVYAAWVVLAPVHLLAVVPTAASLFVLGRALFFQGYARGASGRALGFALTFYPPFFCWPGRWSSQPGWRSAKSPVGVRREWKPGQQSACSCH
jgi:hypothetical protein